MTDPPTWAGSPLYPGSAGPGRWPGYGQAGPKVAWTGGGFADGTARNFPAGPAAPDRPA
jgi:hypothetical protein